MNEKNVEAKKPIWDWILQIPLPEKDEWEHVFEHFQKLIKEEIQDAWNILDRAKSIYGKNQAFDGNEYVPWKKLNGKSQFYYIEKAIDECEEFQRCMKLKGG